MTLAVEPAYRPMIGPRRERSSNNWYVEPTKAVEALIEAEPLFGPGHDPCCGGGNIPKTCLAAGLDCTGSDLVDRGYGVLHDFLSPQPWPFTFPAWVMMNPPFGAGLERQFIDRALTVARWKVCALVRLAFLESQSRRAWFEGSPLARVWVSSSRLSMPPGHLLRDGLVKARGGATPYCWLVFEHGHRGPAQIGWLP